MLISNPLQFVNAFPLMVSQASYEHHQYFQTLQMSLLIAGGVGPLLALRKIAKS